MLIMLYALPNMYYVQMYSSNVLIFVLWVKNLATYLLDCSQNDNIRRLLLKRIYLIVRQY